ncbi:Serine phosphatase RsbU, regulator of sigma subunit [Reichenbachiella faecimaris]|uniref:Serine phosphatase RsbU, regulator of sigma subunit n=1 Tax=Reichenbachiella faecimaris TaxID=692418 RepID=A0A1W2GK50_REIFA|nr:SpoIIE family protein phosphatase [Reichenbachiella faecimaris]SMD37053.1 Serine phosphatase RsbU, regulator of sigma subunit [Reichenbachiella faecimaris]
MNLYLKFVLLGLSLVIFTSVTIFLFVNNTVEKNLSESILSEHSQKAEISINNIDRFIYERLNDVKNFAKLPAFRDENPNLDEVNRMLSEISHANELYYSFSFFDMNRFRLADSKGLSVGKQHGLRLYWTHINDNTEAIMDISKSESVGRVVLHFASVVRNNANQPIGVFVGRVLIENLYAVISNQSQGEESNKHVQMDLLDENLNILYSNHEPEKVLIAKYPDVIPEQVLELKKKEGRFSTDDNLYFYHRQEGYLSFPGKGWLFIINTSKENAFASLSEMRTTILMVGIVILLLSSGLTIYLARVISKPLKKLRSAAVEISKGNYDVQIEGSNKDEIGYLIRQFNVTSQKLKTKENNEKKITKQLMEKNQEIQQHQNKIITQAKAINRAYKEIKTQHTMVHSSLSYAEKIQNAILPDEKLLSDFFQDYFVYYKPKDIVSGDFYWFKHVKNNTGNHLIIACADCSGHGVPGAFLSMLGINALNNAIQYTTDYNPSALLAKVNNDIISTLSQNFSENEAVQEGMEMAICTIDLTYNIMKYAGAGIPLLLFKDGEWNLTKGNKLLLGRNFSNDKLQEQEIEQHSFNLSSHDTFYLYSDGFKDQIGGKEHKKYLPKRFRMYLGMIVQKAMMIQKNLLDKELQDWKQSTPQTDDMLVMGFRIK